MSEDLSLRAFEALKSAGKTFSAAESCTGGLIGKRMTDLPGSSAVYPGGLIVYSDFAKQELLGVPQQILESEGAVSETVALELAQRVRLKMQTDFGIGVTGIAGPDSDGSGNPVGLIYVACADHMTTCCCQLRLDGDRNENREAAADRAFAMLIEAIEA